MWRFYFDRFTASLSVLTQLWVEAQRGVACLERIYWLLDHPAELRRGGLRPQKLQGEITFRNVSVFSGGRRILKNLNLQVAAKQVAALVGPYGSGKSTVVKLLLRQVDPVEGDVHLDQQPLLRYDPVSLRRRLGVVSDPHFFFFATIRDNLTFVKPDATEAELLDVLEQVGLGEWIRRLPDGLDTRIGERGLRLSSGERQRLAIARVLLQDPAIIILVVICDMVLFATIHREAVYH
ncbi:MAG: hypothetical protein DIU76_11955 [Bacillota bacterium]|nr:MAG: hypothetical protein DIU76_11955 [Bacillota bacterium]